MLYPQKRCIRNKLAVKTVCLTIGKVYKVIDTFEASGYTFYQVVNDNGFHEFHISDIFEDVFTITREALSEVQLENYEKWVANIVKL